MLDEIDSIEDFEQGLDLIRLAGSVFGALPAGALQAQAFVSGTVASDALDRVIHDSVTGILWYDADGTGAIEAVAFASLTAGLVLSAADILVL